MRKYLVDKPMQWYKDNKLIIGIVLVILSFILGFWGKVIIIVRFYEPVQLITGLSIYAFSFVLLFIGIFLLGWETVKIIQYRIHHHVRKTVKKTYHHAKGLPKKGYNYTKRLKNKLTEEMQND